MTTRSLDRTRRALAGLVLLALCGCVARSLEPLSEPLPDDWAARRGLLQQQRDFALRGRVALAAADQGFAAGVRWVQRGAAAQIRLDGPLGMGAVTIETDGAALRVTTGRGERLDGEAARLELERQLGFALPLDALRYWVRGLPMPDVPATEWLEEGRPRLARLEQQGWTVEYLEYQPAPAEHRPRRLAASATGARVRMLIESWTP